MTHSPIALALAQAILDSRERRNGLRVRALRSAGNNVFTVELWTDGQPGPRWVCRKVAA